MDKEMIHIIALLCFCSVAVAQDFYVSTFGNDDFNGLSSEPGQAGNGPFQTLERAQKAIRDLKKSGQFNQPVTVHIFPGDYRLKKTLQFDIRDSGFNGREIYWQAEQGQVAISGGIDLQNCQHAQNGYWHCQTPDLSLDAIKYPNSNRRKGNIPGFELFVNEQRMQLARWPNNDWAHIKLPITEKTQFSSMEKLPKINTDRSDTQVHIMAGNDWYDQYIGVSTIDTTRNEIGLSAETGYALTSGRRYYLQNIESQLDAPGEWYYDKSKENILFIPPAGEIPDAVTISTLQNLIAIKGANYLNFQGMSFRHSTDTAVLIDQSDHVKMTDIEINNVGGRAIEAKNSRNITVANSHIHHTGEGGVLSTGGDRKTLKPSNNLIHNNHIHDFGLNILTYTPAIELGGVGSKATNNLVGNSAGNGFIIHGNDHLIEKNEVHHVCEQASDCGAIYTGRDWSYHGNIIRYNSIHDISGYGLKNVDIARNTVEYAKPHGARGVYLDDAASGFTIYGNLFNNAGQMAIQLGGGRDNVIENNIFISEFGYAIWADNRWSTYNWQANRKNLQQVPYQSDVWRSKYPELAEAMHNETWPEGNSIRRNVIISNKPGGLALRYLMPEYTNNWDNNLVWSSTGQFSVDYDILDRLKKRSGAPWQDWIAEGIEEDSIQADPCLTITGNRVSFCGNSPVKQIGFKPIPTDIGLIK